MKSGGPWNLRGLRPEAREAARAAARRSGTSVGEWLNSVIQPVDEEDGEFAPSADRDRDADDSWRQSVPYDDRERHGGHRDANWRGRDGESDDQRRQNFRYDEREQDRRHRDANWRARDHESDDQMRLNFRNDERERGGHRDANRRRDRESGDQWRRARATTIRSSSASTVTRTCGVAIASKRRRCRSAAKALIAMSTAANAPIVPAGSKTAMMNEPTIVRRKTIAMC